MAKTKYSKKIKNGKEYYFFRLNHQNLNLPKDVYGTTIKNLDEKIKKLVNELDNNLITDKKLFLDFFETWLFDIHFINKKGATKEKYEGIYRNYINVTYFKKIKLKDINLLFIQNYYNQLNNNPDVGASIISSIHKLIGPCIRYAFANNRIIKDFSKSLIIPKANKNKKEVNPFTIKEQINFIKAIEGEELEYLYTCALDTGLRQGELFALEWSDIDFTKNIIDVNKAVKIIADVSKIGRGKGTITIQTTKTAKGKRFVPMTQNLSNKLKLLKEKQLIQIKTLANIYNNENLVFTNSVGNYLDSGNVRKNFYKILDKNKIRKIKFHDLRHTYATRLFEAGEEPKVIQELLGHTNIAVTLDTYTHILDKMKVKSVSKLDALYEEFYLNENL